jgi:ABC-2 type transport system ATP-binding protein
MLAPPSVAPFCHHAPVADDVVIEALDLRKAYGTVQAVDGVTFSVARGEILGMLGPNGAGKTTTVEMLEGLRKPDSGGARVLGIDVAREPERVKERIGVQLQTAALYPNLRVSEVIDLFGSFFPRARPSSELIDALDLGDRRGALTKDLSGGQRQRLSIALALVNHPDVLFLDEPTTGLDPQARRSLWDLIASFRKDGTTVLLTTHYMEEAEELCDRVAIMDHGKVLEMGTVGELVARRFKELAVRFEHIPELPDDRLAALPSVTRVLHEDSEVALYTRDVAATIRALLKATAELGREPAHLAVSRASLEDVFLDLTGRALRD